MSAPTLSGAPRARRNLASQGFAPHDDAEARALARAARFQPAFTLALVVAGLFLPSGRAAWFGALAALGWLAVLVPATNVFDALWRLVVKPLTGWPALAATPSPRRFSQGMAASFLTAVAALFALGLDRAAIATAAFMCVAAFAAGFLDVCVGSLIYGALFARPQASRT